MRRTVRVLSEMPADEHLARALTTMPPPVRAALREVADREDMPLVAGSWHRDDGGCLVANVVRTLQPARVAGDNVSLDLRILELLPELSSRDLNRLIVAWDEAAAATGRTDDTGLRRLLRRALAAVDAPEPLGVPAPTS